MNNQTISDIQTIEPDVFASCESFLTNLSANDESIIAGGHHKWHRHWHCHYRYYYRHGKYYKHKKCHKHYHKIGVNHH